MRDTMAFRVKPVLIIAFVVLTVLSNTTQSYVFGANESETAAVISATEDKITACYEAVAEADATGANVTSLLETLNKAGELLSKAELLYEMSDFDSAFNFANQSQNLLDGFVVNAEALTEEAVWTSYWDFLITVVGSLVGVVIVVCSSYVFWYFFKKRHS